MKKAIIKNGVVSNIILTDEKDSQNLISLPDDQFVSIGFSYDDTKGFYREFSNEELKNYIKQYRDARALNFDYKDITMRLTDGARTDLTAVYSVVVINADIPDETVMMNWQEPEFDDLQITAGDLRADGISFMQHRQKCFTASSIVSAQFEETPMTTTAQIEEAFDLAYNDL